MSIWNYAEGLKHESDRETVLKSQCVFCMTPLIRDERDETNVTSYDMMNYGFSDGFRTSAEAVIGACPVCGWWKYGIRTAFPDFNGQPIEPSFELRRGILKSFDQDDAALAINDVRNYLAANYDARFAIHPQVFEDVVASVFRDHGYNVRVTAYSGDDGIDVILDGDAGTTIGVQVKRYKHQHRIAVSQIRELTGALVVGGHTRGIFITTSEFQAGAPRTAALSESRGYPIELIDASRFYDALKIAQLSSTSQVFDSKPWGKVREWTG